MRDKREPDISYTSYVSRIRGNDLLRNNLAHQTVRLFRMVNREHGRALKAIGLSAEQAHILAVLWTQGSKTVGELGRAVALSSPTLSGALDRLEAQKLIRRVPSGEDGRSYRVESLANALQRDRALASISRTSVACFGGLTRDESEELLRLMTKVTDALEVSEPRTDARTEIAGTPAAVSAARRRSARRRAAPRDRAKRAVARRAR
jgi:DNA-binding MarR family transcriptional regulator